MRQRNPIIIAYHLVWTVYGTWLPNDPRGSGSRFVASPALAALPPASSSYIILHDRCKSGDRDTKAHGAGREIDSVGVFGSARIGLRTAIAAEIDQLFLGLFAEQILDGVEYGRRMGLDRDAVFRAQDRKIERRHQRDDRGA